MMFRLISALAAALAVLTVSLATATATATAATHPKVLPPVSGGKITHKKPIAKKKSKRHDLYPLHIGSSGPNVCELRYLLRDPAPKQNVFHVHVKGTYKGPLCSKKHPELGYLGRSFATTGIYAYKYRLGYPSRYNSKAKPIAGKAFINLLRGRAHRTKEMVALAQQRLRLVESGMTAMAAKIKALEVSQLGVTENPWNSNGGPHISYPWPTHGGYPSYQSATGAYWAAWCASFQVWAFHQAGYGWIGDRSAGVLYIEDWARRHGYLASKPHAGSLVAYLDDGGHIGFIARVTASGYSEISGNTSNAVHETWHPWNYRLRVFINLPGV
jgi:hypothetical protein